MADNEHSTASLGDSEVARVENPVGDMEPEVGQRLKHDPEVPAIVRGEEAGYVLQEDPSVALGEVELLCDACELEEEAGAGSVKTGSLAGDGEILAGEAPAEDVGSARLAAYQPYVFREYRLREAMGEDTAPPRVELALQDDVDACSLEAEVEAADSGEEAPCTEPPLIHAPPPPTGRST